MQYTQEILWLLNEKYNGRVSPEFKHDCARITSGEPVSYVIGSHPFCGCSIDLSRRPLIPRVETEWWVEKAIEEIRKEREGRSIRVLDLFSGSGCIGIALAASLPQAQVDFVDSEERFLEQIQINIESNGINPTRTRLIESNVFEKVKDQYHYIFANPPYIDKDNNRADSSVLAWEPHEALFAPDHGLYYLKRTINETLEHLVSGGSLYLEYDTPQKKELEKLARSLPYSFVEFRKDQYDRWRWACLTK